MANYSKMTDKEINDGLEFIGEDKWHLHEDLLKEGLKRWLKLSGFTKSELNEGGDK